MIANTILLKRKTFFEYITKISPLSLFSAVFIQNSLEKNAGNLKFCFFNQNVLRQPKRKKKVEKITGRGKLKSQID